MQRIGLIADTHGYLDPRVERYFADCDEIWHAGDFGTLEVAQALERIKPLRGVFGNVDGPELRDAFPEHTRFTCEAMDVWLTHIGGYPPRYDRRVRQELQQSPPDLFICGHSHILRVVRDPQLGLLHLNPGAAGRQGFHTIMTLLILEITGQRVTRLQAVELGPRR